MSDLPICDFRLETRCGVCYECQVKKLKAQVELLENSKEKHVELISMYDSFLVEKGLEQEFFEETLEKIKEMREGK